MLGRDSVPVLDEDTQLVDALGVLSEADVHRGLVLEGDRLVGFLSISDLVRALEVGGIRRRRAA
jgi:CBS domain-containing protein